MRECEVRCLLMIVLFALGLCTGCSTLHDATPLARITHKLPVTTRQVADRGDPFLRAPSGDSTP